MIVFNSTSIVSLQQCIITANVNLDYQVEKDKGEEFVKFELNIIIEATMLMPYPDSLIPYTFPISKGSAQFKCRKTNTKKDNKGNITIPKLQEYQHQIKKEAIATFWELTIQEGEDFKPTKDEDFLDVMLTKLAERWAEKIEIELG